MAELDEVVPLKEAKLEIGIAMTRLALMHLAYSKTLVEELREEKGKKLIIKSILEYGKRVGRRTKEGHQDLPRYGVHGKYIYAGEEYSDLRKIPKSDNGNIDYSLYEVADCSLAIIFKEYGEEDLGCFYCYVDAAKSMAADPSYKLIHKACEACGDESCKFDVVPTTEKERRDFENKNSEWKHVDPILIQ